MLCVGPSPHALRTCTLASAPIAKIRASFMIGGPRLTKVGECRRFRIRALRRRSGSASLPVDGRHERAAQAGVEHRFGLPVVCRGGGGDAEYVGVPPVVPVAAELEHLEHRERQPRGDLRQPACADVRHSRDQGVGQVVERESGGPARYIPDRSRQLRDVTATGAAWFASRTADQCL